MVSNDAQPAIRVLAGVGLAEELRAALGGTRADALVRLLYERAMAFARAELGAAAVTVDRGEGPLGTRLAGVVAAAEGPVIAVVPELAGWRPGIVAEALDDLRHGCAVTLGPVFDGGFYLIGVDGPPDALAAIPGAGWDGRDARAGVMAVVARAGLEMGLLRPEHALRGPADVRALLADPLTDSELRALVS